MDKSNVYDSHDWKSEKKEIKEILHKSPFKRFFANTCRIHSLLKRADARGIADIFYRICDAYR